MCTDFLLAAADGGFVNGRSMEFGLELNSRPFVRRRGEVMRSPAPDKPRARDGLQWRVKYGYVGMNALRSVDGRRRVERARAFGRHALAAAARNTRRSSVAAGR